MDDLDLNINHYSYQDLLHLFKIQGEITNNTLKQIRKTVLQLHPDKCKLNPEYYAFFNKAYQRIQSTHSFQNKQGKKANVQYEDFTPAESDKIQMKQFMKKQSGGFNSWFNEKYNQYNGDLVEKGYGEWLQSNDDLHPADNIIDLDRKKQQMQSLITYQEIGDFEPMVRNLHFMDLGETANYTSTDPVSTFTDLKQAYTETVIPITQRDCDNVKQFSNIQEFVSHRNHHQQNVQPLNETEANEYFTNRESKLNDQSAFIAYKWCMEAEQAVQKNNQFQSEMRKIKW